MGTKIMYTKKDFGHELKERVSNNENVAEIGNWAFSIYLEHIEDINDAEFRNILLTLNHMSNEPGFELSYQRLNEIADDLIAGKKNINLDY